MLTIAYPSSSILPNSSFFFFICCLFLLSSSSQSDNSWADSRGLDLRLLSWSCNLRRYKSLLPYKSNVYLITFWLITLFPLTLVSTLLSSYHLCYCRQLEQYLILVWSGKCWIKMPGYGSSFSPNCQMFFLWTSWYLWYWCSQVCSEIKIMSF